MIKIFNKKNLSIIIPTLLFSTYSFSNDVSTENDLPLHEIHKMAEVFSIIDQYYVEDVDKQKLVLEALSGMVESLDPYSHYLTEDEAKSFTESISGENVGLGVVISHHEKGLLIETVLKNSPAEKAGLKSKDIIIKIGEKYINENYNKNLDAVKDIRGEKGTNLNITILENKTSKIKELNITRSEYKVPSTEVQLLNDNYGYIYVSSFNQDTHDSLYSLIKDFNKKYKNTKGYVLDLRSNPGGLLGSAVSISDMFLNKGNIVSTKNRNPDMDASFEAENGDVLNGKPIVVLINEGTASAAEILAGALQDNKRAIIVGQTSYGKGSVQTIVPMSGSDGDMLKITTARYYTPSGKSIQAEGISPDIYIQDVLKVDIDKREKLREKDNKNHISNDTDYKSEIKKSNKGIYVDIESDYQLNEALNTLKAITTLK